MKRESQYDTPRSQAAAGMRERKRMRYPQKQTGEGMGERRRP